MALLLHLQGISPGGDGGDGGEGIVLAVGRRAGGSGEGFSSYFARALQQRHGNGLACVAVAGDGTTHGHAGHLGIGVCYGLAQNIIEGRANFQGGRFGQNDGLAGVYCVGRAAIKLVIYRRSGSVAGEHYAERRGEGRAILPVCRGSEGSVHADIGRLGSVTPLIVVLRRGLVGPHPHRHAITDTDVGADLYGCAGSSFYSRVALFRICAVGGVVELHTTVQLRIVQFQIQPFTIEEGSAGRCAECDLRQIAIAIGKRRVRGFAVHILAVDSNATASTRCQRCAGQNAGAGIQCQTLRQGAAYCVGEGRFSAAEHLGKIYGGDCRPHRHFADAEGRSSVILRRAVDCHLYGLAILADELRLFDVDVLAADQCKAVGPCREVVLN